MRTGVSSPLAARGLRLHIPLGGGIFCGEKKALSNVSGAEGEKRLALLAPPSAPPWPPLRLASGQWGGGERKAEMALPFCKEEADKPGDSPAGGNWGGGAGSRAEIE